MIQQDYGGAYVAASVSEELLSHEAVNRIVCVEEKSDHHAVRSDAVDIRTLEGTGARARNVELHNGAVLIAHKTVIHI